MQILVDVHAHDLVGREEAVVDALAQRVGVHRLTEVVNAGNLFGFLGRCGQANVRGVAEVIEDFAPGRVFGGAAAMAFVDHDEVKEVGRELLVDVFLFFVAGDRLIEREVNLERLVGLPVGDFGHRRAERLEVVGARLVDEDVAVSEE